jgi:hypothetical protein
MATSRLISVPSDDAPAGMIAPDARAELVLASPSPKKVDIASPVRLALPVCRQLVENQSRNMPVAEQIAQACATESVAFIVQAMPAGLVLLWTKEHLGRG